MPQAAIVGGNEMYVIMGATGHVGSAVDDALLDLGETVTIVTRDSNGADAWRERGADIAEADVNDVDSLRSSFRRGERAFLLNPPSDPQTDTDAIERRSVANILAALEGSGLEKVVAQSTYGAQAGERIGDLSVLWEFEEGLRRQPIPAAIDRAAYYMSNWDSMVDVDVTPRGQWEEAFLEIGFSRPAAQSYTRMTEVSVDGDFELPDDPRRGSITLQEYVRALVGCT